MTRRNLFTTVPLFETTVPRTIVSPLCVRLSKKRLQLSRITADWAAVALFHPFGPEVDRPPHFGDFLIDCEEDRTLRRAVLVGDVGERSAARSEPLVGAV
jgi:hypothetical protein